MQDPNGIHMDDSIISQSKLKVKKSRSKSKKEAATADSEAQLHEQASHSYTQ